MPRLATLIDERFLTHRLKSTSAAGLAAVAVAMGLFIFRIYHDHRFSWDLLAVGIVAVVVKYAVFFWHRRND